MTMAVLNILSQPTTPWPTKTASFSLYSCNHYYTNCYMFSCYDRFSVGPSLSSLSKAVIGSAKPSFSSPMLPRSPKSGTEVHVQAIDAGLGCSWIQDSSTCPDTVSNNGRRQRPLHSVFPSKPAEVSSVQDLFEFICSGPLLNKLGMTSEMVAESIDKWLAYGLHLCRLFQLNELYLTIPQKARFYHYYIPVFLWCEQQISHHSSTFKDGEEVTPIVIGFSAPQGCGKTTLVFALEYLFKVTRRKSATVSIDDFYLTADDQAKLRESKPGNALLELRGNAGSHDLSFSVETLTALSKLTKEGMKMKLPRYDKSANNGRGDRADPSTWPEVEGPLKMWM
ncbi:hypothetical protein RHGRI_035253 [Rhododendron griersonianum]|uniref:D-glycerate 3-kinase, chloroplastic n=1 Tax=Rhododendron griersonianum TaxID=479676 RepID=A0AAV6I4F3_9ERIC|nr:hypothetical protein RHGRI_035253 [Rhododendron griersonianum]